MIPVKRVKHFKRFALAAALLLFAFGSVFAIYVYRQFRVLEEEFLSVQETIPTRFFSDAKRIHPALPRKRVEAVLTRLHYETKSESPSRSRFHLRPISYPIALLPEGHPTLALQNHDVVLEFGGTSGDAPLTRIVDEAGAEVPEFFLEPEQVATLARGSSKVRGILTLEEIPTGVWRAILSVEDQHFLEHAGIDPRGMIRAIWVNLRTLSLAQGGSTITQQLVKNLLARRTKNVVRKFSEIFLALLLEARFGKERILERYLNEVYLGQIGPLEIHGVAEGARFFFGKDVRELRLSEIALLAGVIRGTGFYSPYRHPDRALARRNLVLEKMAETAQIAPEEAEEAKKDPLLLAPPSVGANRATFFTDLVRAQLERELSGKYPEEYLAQAGFRVYTTLDLDLQDAAEAAMEKQLAALEARKKLTAEERLEGALLVVDPVTGNARAVLGSRDYARSSFHRAIHMRRQAGSTMKPIVLLAALERGVDSAGAPYGPAYPIEDAPWTLKYDSGRQSWTPKDFDKDYRGWITLRRALAESINVPFAKIASDVGLERVVDVAKRLGFEGEVPEVPSIALGSNEVTLRELARAYATIANHGIRPEITAIRTVTLDDGRPFARFEQKPEPALEAWAADWAIDFLRSTFEIGSARSARSLGFTRPAFGKTGTTNDSRDAWFVGGAPGGPITAVWVGFDRDDIVKKPIRLSGAEAALPVWVEIQSTALESVPIQEAKWEESLEEVRMDVKSGMRAPLLCSESQTLLERYAKGRVPDQSACADDFPKGRR